VANIRALIQDISRSKDLLSTLQPQLPDVDAPIDANAF